MDHIFFSVPFTISLVLGTTLVVMGLIFGNITKQQLFYVNTLIRKKISKMTE